MSHSPTEIAMLQTQSSLDGRVFENHTTLDAVLKTTDLPIAENPSLMHLWNYHVQKSPDALAGLLPNDAKTDFVRVTLREFDQIVDKTLNKLRGDRPFCEGCEISCTQCVTSGLLANIPPRSWIGVMMEDNLSQLLVLMALLRADFNLLLLTAKQSRVSVENLMAKTGAVCVITSENLKERLNRPTVGGEDSPAPKKDLDIRTLPNAFSVEKLVADPVAPKTPNREPRENEFKEVRFCLHSSGSTSLPHPIYQPNFKIIADVVASKGKMVSYDVPPLKLVLGPIAHQMGFGSILAELLVSATPTVFILSQTFPGTPEQILRTIDKAEPVITLTVPAIIEDVVRYLGDDDPRWSILQKMKTLAYGGASLPPKVGKLLTDKNIRVTSGLGSTEGGLNMYRTPDETNTFNNSFFPVSQCSWRMRPLDGDIETATEFELIILKGSPGLAPGSVNCEEGFATEDVFQKGQKIDEWFYMGRKGDTLVHVNGEKTNALILESTVENNAALVKTCQIVGSGHSRCGILIELEWEKIDLNENWDSSNFRDLLESSETLKKIYTHVWQAVQAANVVAPAQSQITKNMIYLMPKGDVLERSDKGNIRRSKNTRAFSEEIDSLYTRGLPSAKLTDMKSADLESLVSQSLAETLMVDESKIRSHPDQSVFDMGMSSVTATAFTETLQERLGAALPPTFIYNFSTAEEITAYLQRHYGEDGPITKEAIAKLLEQVLPMSADQLMAQSETAFTDLGVTSVETPSIRQTIEDYTKLKMPWDIVFEAPSLSALTAAVQRVQRGDDVGGIATHLKDVEELEFKYNKLIQNLATDLPPMETYPKCTNSRKRVVLLTGASGHLGVHLVAQLCATKRVQTIVCLMRGGRERLMSVMKARGISPDEVLGDTEIECFEFDTRDQNFGQSPEIFEKLLTEVTDVFHNAWTVNFNLRVRDFEKDWLTSTFNLIKFCCVPGHKVKSFNLTSSVSSVARGQFKNGKIPEEFFGSAQREMALNMGYGQSKFIAESMCHQARKSLQLNAHVHRCGQISGDTIGGVWKQDELVPMLIVNGGGDLGMIPTSVSTGDFIPIDICAATMVEILMKQPVGLLESDQNQYVWHLWNPYGGTWIEWLDAFQGAGLKFDRTDAETFLQAVREHKENPLNKLYAALVGMVSGGESDALETTKTCAMSQALTNCPKVSRELAWLSLQFWRSSGFLKH